MGVKDSFDGASMVAKIALAVLLVANLLSWLAFTTSSWAEAEANGQLGSIGIWRACNGATSGIIGCTQLDGTPTEWYGAFQAFAIFGFVLINVAFTLVIFFIFMDKCKGDKEVSLAITITGIAAAVCWLIAVIIFAAEYEDINSSYDLEYSFGLAIVAFILAACGGVAMIFAQGGGASTKPSG